MKKNDNEHDGVESKSPVHRSLLEALENIINEEVDENSQENGTSDESSGLGDEDMALISILGKSVKEVFTQPRDELEIDSSLIVSGTGKEVDKEILDEYEDENLGIMLSLSKKAIERRTETKKRKKWLLEFCNDLHHSLTGYRFVDSDIIGFLEELDVTSLDSYPEWTKSSLKRAIESLRSP
ncbi:MAG: hypothetical protein ACFFD4_39575 [Candidatus Odinarchaeota archaeon]